MYLVYVDESGNTGTNFNDAQQPIFVLSSLIVPEERWLAIERELEKSIRDLFPELAEQEAEIHATDLRNGCGDFSKVPVSERLALRDSWLAIAGSFELKVIYRAIAKKRFQAWLHTTFGTGVLINPLRPFHSWLA
jgi:hypothetical protein